MKLFHNSLTTSQSFRASRTKIMSYTMMHPLNIIKKLRIRPLPKESLDYERTSPLIIRNVEIGRRVRGRNIIK